MYILKAKDVIKAVREDMQELYDMHMLAVSTAGEQGFLCLDIDAFLRLMNRSDREILESYIARGAEIEDVDEYLASLK